MPTENANRNTEGRSRPFFLSDRGTLERTLGVTNGLSIHRIVVKSGIGLKAYPKMERLLKQPPYGEGGG